MKVSTTSAGVAIIDTVVELDSLVPVVHAGVIVEAVVARSFSGLFVVGTSVFAGEADGGLEGFAPAIIEVVGCREVQTSVVVFAKVGHTFGSFDGMIFTRHVIGHEVDDHLHPSLMGSIDKFLPFLHPAVDVDSEVGIDIVIVGDGVGRPCPTLYDGTMLAGNAETGVIGLGGMSDNAGIPHVGDAELAEALKHYFIKVVELAATVFGNRSSLFAGGVAIAENAG